MDRCCFVFQDIATAKRMESYLESVLNIKATLKERLNSPAIFVAEEDYEQAINLGTMYLLQNGICEGRWIDSNQSLVRADLVPLLYAEVPSNLKLKDGNWKKILKRGVQHYSRCYEQLLERAIYAERTPSGNVKFYLARTDGVNEDHKMLRQRMVKYFKTHPNVFKKATLCDSYGCLVKKVKEVA